MTKDEALEMAIDAMRSYQKYYMNRAINACKEALEQPEGKEFFERGKEIARWADKTAQEPLGWIPATYKYNLINNEDAGLIGMVYLSKHNEDDVAVYSHPHQWQGLTEKEKVNFTEQGYEIRTGAEAYELVCAIEQALKEKNHGA
jgi:hypothetical protein